MGGAWGWSELWAALVEEGRDELEGVFEPEISQLSVGGKGDCMRKIIGVGFR
jgi:hypothetical protein